MDNYTGDILDLNNGSSITSTESMSATTVEFSVDFSMDLFQHPFNVSHIRGLYIFFYSVVFICCVFGKLISPACQKHICFFSKTFITNNDFVVLY